MGLAKKIKQLLCGCFIATVLASDISSSETSETEVFDLNYTQFIIPVISHISNKITVKIWDDRYLGSGTIIQQQDGRYEVVTNSHVVRIGDPPYRIQTSDGKFHQAEVVALTNQKNWDLAILTFQEENQIYDIPEMGSSDSLTIGDYVFAGGFPGKKRTTNSPELTESDRKEALEEADKIIEFSLATGRVSLVLEKSLTAGYQIGSTHLIKKGMSGGPLLNEQGQLVGINGKHAYPLWPAPELYEDGSQTCLPLQKFIYEHSWAVPIEKVTSFYQEIRFFLPNISPEENSGLDPASNVPETLKIEPPASKIVQQMELQADLALSCESDSP